MAVSKANRIKILLAIDTVFFLIELITGYAVHSLALVADSFHMLNDVLSLCVGLWAVKVASSKERTNTFTYGWQRAETLGALVNGVFLVALCVTIFLEAIQRFVEPQEVSQPKLVLIVGCLGLGSNILGLFLFHDHSHSHGSGGHSHGEETHDEIDAAEQGHAHAHGHSHDHEHSPGSDTTAVESDSPLAPRISTESRQSAMQRKHSRSQSRAFMNGEESIPSSAYLIRKSVTDRSLQNRMEESEEDGEDELEDEMREAAVNEAELDRHDSSGSPLLSTAQNGVYGTMRKRSKSINHRDHHHAKPKEKGKGGHSHSDLNMRGIFLHVMGDALGNIGVIFTALIIWLTDYSWRFYCDPAISLIITVIILCSAIPLCKAASKILLQAVPDDISVDELRDDIRSLPDIIGVHHLHVWQLSDTKKVASVHVQVASDIKRDGSARYMELAQAINNCLRAYGIYSSTIQPEFCLDPEHDHSSETADGSPDDSHSSAPAAGGKKLSAPGSRVASKPASMREPDACLLGCEGDMSCCPPPAASKHGDDGHDHTH